MPEFLKKQWYGSHMIALFSLAVVFIVIVSIYQWKIGIIGFFLLGVVLLFSFQARKRFEGNLEDYISTLSYRVNKAGEEAVVQMPIGIILYNNDSTIQWANPYMSSFLEGEFFDKSLDDISKEIIPIVEDEQEEEKIMIDGKYYHMFIKREERLLYFFDMTEKEETLELYHKEKTVIGFIYLDNYDEVTQGMDDQVRSKLMSKITSALNQWANDYEVFLRRTSTDRFMMICNQESLQEIETTRFEILDHIRDVTAKEKVSITLSVGIGSGETSVRELGDLAQSSLDLALGRGGDQVAIKQKAGKVRFYGGKSNAVEKRTRVRARVISHALRDFVLESDQIMIMGHKNPDMDAIGAAIGVSKIADVNDKVGSIVVDPTDINPDVQKLMEEIEYNDRLSSVIITPEQAREEVTSRTLLVVVDTHRPSLVIEPALLKKAERVIVLDHHRRGEEFIEDPVLVYMEPYASSTAELVTELLEYQPKNINMSILEATALMAGIIVDTKSFAIRTGARTFDAASFLRSNGADTTLVQKLLKEDLEQYVKRSKLIESATIYKDGLTIAKAAEGETYDQVLIAQAADTLLTMNDVTASFVISKRKDGRTSISARSLGEVNVQVIMEELNGGGHLTNAATQLEGVSIDETEDLLRRAIDHYLEGGN
ncbi:DHH family phosphoesterase [Desertibacillus haloalkaliphilus]|uniref:DHH family phosphoesterase n=1 Tax=Desertibacillus haloalkaliphilus TaxID=1328930 RepID=UPI001C260C9F|nr:DHH family phosphoesterase [Desertibacillus haloalkaliphilus]MBU8905778.1 DHH family phosphoesterase [Desertibacillus haloalkaliphilus]